MSEPELGPFDVLPPEVIRYIGSKVDPVSLASFYLTSYALVSKMTPEKEEKKVEDGDEKEEEAEKGDEKEKEAEEGDEKEEKKVKEGDEKEKEAEEGDEKEDKTISKRPKFDFDVLGLPHNIEGFGLCEEAVLHDLADLFDYWSVRINPKGHKLSIMVRNAGMLPSRERSLFWIGKIFSFIYSKPSHAKNMDIFVPEWSSFIEGIAESGNLNKFKEMVPLPQYEDDDDEELEDEDASFFTCLDLALRNNHFELAEYIIDANRRIYTSDTSGSEFNDVTDPDRVFRDNPYCSSTLWHRIAGFHKDVVVWFLDKTPSNFPENVSIRRLNVVLTNIVGTKDKRPNRLDLIPVLNHPLFASIPDSKFRDVRTTKDLKDCVKVHRLPAEAALFLLSHRPRLTMLNTMLWKTWKDLIPAAEEYVKTMSARQVHEALAVSVPSSFWLKKLLKMFPLPKTIDMEMFGKIFSNTIDLLNKELEEDHPGSGKFFAARLFVELNSEFDILGFLVDNYPNTLFTMLGDGIFTDEEIISAAKKKKAEKEMARKSKALKVKDAASLKKVKRGRDGLGERTKKPVKKMKVDEDGDDEDDE